MTDSHLAISAVLSSLHVLAFGIGLPAVVLRGRALKGPLDAAAVKRVLTADAFWAVAGVLWIVTGGFRAFVGFEKGTAYYMGTSLFHTKLGLVVLLVLLELVPMVTLMGWRVARSRGQSPDTSKARLLFVINHVQLAIVGVILFLASFAARGFGRIAAG